ncbi:MAG TPA: UDP-galactopyranose mutase [Sphingomicrobium sp.]|nr:UDP-galactopyranose mutase [Sphingomicrobium sp.]
MQVLFWEEPHFDAQGASWLERAYPVDGVEVITPHLVEGTAPELVNDQLQILLDETLASRTGPLVRWYYTPMMLPFSRHLRAECTVYDCMDELANFDFAPPELPGLECELLHNADVVFTGGVSLYEAKRSVHPSVHAFPSSVDVAHFKSAREIGDEPLDQASLPANRLGFYGVIDERIDLALLAAVADARPNWTIVMVGPVAKIDPATLPKRENIHFLGSKTYDELPLYAAGWDVALMPFAINAATQFISPTKTPEYLAAGLPVVSTTITDVVRHYGELEGVKIATTPDEFVAACDQLLGLGRSQSSPWMVEADHLLADLSWDKTVGEMLAHIDQHRAAKLATPVRDHFDYLVVGAGFAASVMAERLASGGSKVLIIDRRPHIGGNAFDHLDESGVMIHKYGPHIFHTNSQEIVDYLSRFTKWRAYEHRVLCDVDGRLVPMPINRTTLNLLDNLNLKTDAEADRYLASLAEPVAEIRTSEDVVVSKVGRKLYETFFRGYTRKQWGIDPSELDKSVTSRVPTRTNTDDRYFTDTFQAMPAAGYTAMFERMLDHPGITIRLGVDYRDVVKQVSFGHLVFTGPIDEFFDHRFGKLPYRSLEFRHENLDQERFQPVATVNYPAEDVPYTRITEYKYLTGQKASTTSITYEYPRAEGDPYYPVPRPENEALFKRYEALADARSDVTFVGRLATYRYYNMDQVVGQALATYRRHARQKKVETAAFETVAAE